MKEDIIYCSVDDIIHREVNLDIKIDNIHLNEINVSKALSLLKTHNMIKDNNVIIPKYSKVFKSIN